MRRVIFFTLLIIYHSLFAPKLSAVSEFPQLQKYLAGEAGRNLSWDNPVSMQLAQDGLWSATIPISPGKYIEFKFLVDDLNSGEQLWEENYFNEENDDVYGFMLVNGETVIEKIYNNNHKLYLSPTDTQVTIMVNWAGRPDVPTNFKIVPRDGYMELFWTSSKEYDVIGYNIYRSTEDVDTAFEKINTTPFDGQTYIDSPLLNGTTYFYKVTSQDAYAPPLGPLESIFTEKKHAVPNPPIDVIFMLDLGASAVSDTLYIAGEPSALSWDQWEPLQNSGDGYWSVTIKYTPTTEVYYKYVWGGDWEEGENRFVYIQGDTQMIVVGNWEDTPSRPELSAYPDSGRIILKWDQNSKDVYVGMGGFEIYKSTDGSFFTQIAQNIQSDSFIDTNVVNGSSYYYFIVAVDASSQHLRSDTSNKVNVKPRDYVPVVFDVDVGLANPSSIVVIGEVKGMSDITDVLVWRRGDEQTKMSYIGDGIWRVLKYLVPGWAIEYKYSYDPDPNDPHNGTNDEPIANRTFTLPETIEDTYTISDNWGNTPRKPSITNYLPFDQAVYLEWSPGDLDVTGETGGFCIYRSTSTSGPFKLIAEFLDATTYFDTGLVNDVKYFYYLYAYDSTRDHLKSARSDMISVTPKEPIAVTFYVDVGHKTRPNVVQLRGQMPDISFVPNWDKDNTLSWDIDAPIMENTGDSINYTESWVYTLKLIPGWQIQYKYVIDGELWDEIGSGNRQLTVPDTDTIIEDNWGEDPAKPDFYLLADTDRVFIYIAPNEYDVGGEGSGFIIYRSTTADFSSSKKVVEDWDSGVYIDYDVQEGILYYYRVQAKDGTHWHTLGDLSDIKSIKPSAKVKVNFLVDMHGISDIDAVYLSKESLFDLSPEKLSYSDFESGESLPIIKGAWSYSKLSDSDGDNVWGAEFELYSGVGYRFKYFYATTEGETFWEEAPPDEFFYYVNDGYSYVTIAGAFNSWQTEDYILDKYLNAYWYRYLKLNSGYYEYKFLPDGVYEDGSNRSVNVSQFREVDVMYSNTTTANDWEGPPSPFDFNVLPNDGYCMLYWDTTSIEKDISKVEIYRSETSRTEGFVKVGEVLASAAEYIDTNLQNGQKYYYRIKVYDGGDTVKSSFSIYKEAVPSEPIDVYFVLDYGASADYDIMLMGAPPVFSWENGIKLQALSDYPGVYYKKLQLIPTWPLEFKFKLNTGYQDSGWEPGDNRYYTVQKDADGIMKIMCNWGEQPAKPTAKVYLDSGSIRLKWSLSLDDGDEEIFSIFRSTSSDMLANYTSPKIIIDGYEFDMGYTSPDTKYQIYQTSNLSISSYTDTALINGQKYYYYLMLQDRQQWIPAVGLSDIIVATPDNPVPVIFQLDVGNIDFDSTAIKGDEDLPQLNWDPTEGPYLSYISDTGMYEVTLDFVPGQEIEYKFIGLNGSDVYWEDNIQGNRTYTVTSDTSQVLYHNWDNEPLPPSDLSSQGRDFGIKLMWQPSKSLDVAYYKVYTSLFKGGPYEYVGSTTDTGLTFTTKYYNRVYYSVVKAVDSESYPLESGYSEEIAETSADFDPPQVVDFRIIDSIRLLLVLDEPLDDIEFRKLSYYAVTDTNLIDTIYLKSVEYASGDSCSYIFTIADTSYFKHNKWYKFFIKGVPDASILKNRLYDTIIFKSLRYYKRVLYDTSAVDIISDSLIIKIPESALPDGVKFPVTISIKTYSELSNLIREKVDEADTAAVRNLTIQPLPYNMPTQSGDTYIPVYQIILYDAFGRNIFADYDRDGKPDRYFKKYVTITIGYPDSEAPAGIVDTTKNYPEDRLRIFRLDELKNKWEYVWDKGTITDKLPDAQQVHPDSNVVEALLGHLSVYTLLYTVPKATGWENVVVYPNPFVPYDNNFKTGTLDQSKPYWGVNFYGLPPDVERITIYTITGDLVRILEVEDGEISQGMSAENGALQAYAVWDIENEVGQTVASGVYVFVIEKPGTKPYIGKIGIVK